MMSSRFLKTRHLDVQTAEKREYKEDMNLWLGLEFCGNIVLLLYLA